MGQTYGNNIPNTHIILTYWLPFQFYYRASLLNPWGIIDSPEALHHAEWLVYIYCVHKCSLKFIWHGDGWIKTLNDLYISCYIFRCQMRFKLHFLEYAIHVKRRTGFAFCFGLFCFCFGCFYTGPNNCLPFRGNLIMTQLRKKHG